MKELDQVREIFLSDDIDPETRADNEEKLKEWEQSLSHNEALQSWKEHEITKQIIQQAKNSYVQVSLQLMDRRYSEQMRESFWAKKDALEWIISLASEDPKAEIARIMQDIKAALNS